MLRPTDRRVSSRDPDRHLGTQLLHEGAQMSGGNVVPLSLSAEVGEDGSVEPAHPVERILSPHAVRDVLVRLVGRAGRTGRGRHDRHRTPRKALAVLAAGLVALLASVLGNPVSPAQADDADPVTFKVGFTGDVDSLNPFTGYNAESYELWSLSYDFMIGYSMKDMSPVPSLATDWETSEDGLTWTFDIRAGVKWQDGEPLTAADIAYTYNRVMTGRVEGGNYSSYLTNVSQRDRAGRHDRRAHAVEAQRGTPAAADPDRARAHLEGHRREGGEDLPARPGHPRDDRRLRPLPARRGQDRRIDVPLRGQPRLLGRCAARRPGGLHGLPEQGPGHPGADQGRGRLRQRHHAAPGEGAAGRARHQRTERRLSDLRGDRLQHRRDRHRDGRAAR